MIPIETLTVMFFKKNDPLYLKLAKHNNAFWLNKSEAFTENIVQMVSIWGAKINKNIMQINTMK